METSPDVFIQRMLEFRLERDRKVIHPTDGLLAGERAALSSLTN